MVPAGVGMQRAGHGGVDDLVVAVGQGAHVQPIEDGMFDVVGAAAVTAQPTSVSTMH